MMRDKATLLALAALAAAGVPVVGGGAYVIRRRPGDDGPLLPPQPRPARAPYVPATLPLTDRDREQIEAAAAKRARKNAKRRHA